MRKLSWSKLSKIGDRGAQYQNVTERNGVACRESKYENEYRNEDSSSTNAASSCDSREQKNLKTEARYEMRFTVTVFP